MGVKNSNIHVVMEASSENEEADPSNMKVNKTDDKWTIILNLFYNIYKLLFDDYIY